MQEFSNKSDQIHQLLLDPRLDYLAAELQRFNIFRVLRCDHSELKHSDFLAYLLCPASNHELGADFLRRFLQLVLTKVPSENRLNSITAALWDFSESTVAREQDHVDVLVVNKDHKVVIAIENKWAAKEHSQQLERYEEKIRAQYSEYEFIGIFLSKDGEEPEQSKSFLPTDYESVYEALRFALSLHRDRLPAQALAAIEGYLETLRRHALQNSDIKQLCVEIYRKHHEALDLIFEHRPDVCFDVYEHLMGLIAAAKGTIESDDSRKSYIRFAPSALDFQSLRVSTDWTESRRILLFEFQNWEDGLTLKLMLGKGSAEIRQKILDFALNHRPPFAPAFQHLKTQWNQLYSYPFLRKQDYSDGSEREKLFELIDQRWQEFLTKELPKFVALADELKTAVE